jgi:N-glycosylase/DNA lyase
MLSGIFRMLVGNNETLAQIAQEYSKLIDSFQRRKKWNEMSEKELWEELCLCILSSNVPYELALSAFRHLLSRHLLRQEWIVRSKSAFQHISHELLKRAYLPRRKNGSYRKYRFPNTRARNIVEAAKTLYQKNHGIRRILKNSNYEREARSFLAKNVSGIGLKQASHFLRNVGYSSSLAIIDSHVITFLVEVGAVQDEKIKAVTPKTYIRLERILHKLCESFGFNLSIFDMAIWRYMRGKRE